MVNDRTYKLIKHRQVLNEIKDKSKSQFDSNIAEMFIDIMKNMEQVVYLSKY